MAKARRLTEAGVERVRPEARRVEYPDTVVPGLRLVVQPNGKKSWAVRTRVRGRSAKITIGPYPAYRLGSKEKPEDGTARAEAQEILNLAKRGEDPRVVRHAAEADTVEVVVAEWLRRDQADNRGHAKVKRKFERDVLPRWKGRLVTEIDRRDVIDVIDRVVDRGSTGAARRLHAHLLRFFRWSRGRGIVDANPMEGLPKPGSERPRDRVLTDRELYAVWRAAGELGWPYGPAVRLLVLTGARQSEIGGATWSEVDVDRAAIQLSRDRTKTGEPRTIPLSLPAAEIVAGLPRVENAVGYVFPTRSGRPISSWGDAKRRVEEIIGGGTPLGDWRFHDLRRTVATGLQRLGGRLEVIEAVLGHVSGSRGGIVGVYQRHSFDDEKRAALDLWAESLDALIRGEGATNVVPLPRRA